MSEFPKFEFRDVKLHSPHENICAAVSILQAHILAEDSTMNAESMFGDNYFKGAGLEVAVAMLVPVIEQLEKSKWRSE